MPSASSCIHSASSASGNAASDARLNETPRSRCSTSYARFNARHIEGRAGGRLSGEGIELNSFFFLAAAETRGLQIEHRVIAPPGGHQLVMGTEFDDPAVFQNANAVSLTNGREAV